ncbi:MAG: VWA domain-containing protein, partial [Acidobacteria bacterium]|nr:VWA domain-containing protein [Acidobacteriota bacterium]
QAIVPKSPTHPILVEAVDGGSRVILAEGAPLDRDLVVCWCPLKQDVGVQLIEGPGLPGDEGRYALLAITPPAHAVVFHGRDLTLLIDASGSMEGKPLALAKAVAADLLKSLGPRDRFEVLAFSIGIQELVKGPLEATERNLQRALKELHGLRAGGGTEMAAAVLDALKPLRAESQRQVILITDGYVGFEQEVTRRILKNLPDGARLHTVGIGAAPNRTLTRWAARAGRGVELILGEQDAAPAVSERLRQATVAPILTDLMVSGSVLAGMAPARPRDLFEGQPLGVALRLNPEGGSLEVRARMAGGRDTWIKQVQMAPRSQDRAGDFSGKEIGLALGALYGREAIEDCEMELAACSPREEERIEGEIEALGLRHRIASRRTSLVAVAEEPSVDPKEARRRRHLAVELPRYVSAEGTGLLATRGDIPFQLMRAGIADMDASARSLFDSMTFGLSKAHRKSARPTKFEEVDAEGPSHLACEIADPARFISGEIVRLEKDLIIVEFDSPADEFMLPGPGDEVRMDLLVRHSRSSVVVNLEESQSTRPGPHARGLRLRLVLRRQDGSAWNITGRFTAVIHWNAPDAREICIVVLRDRSDGEAA